MKKTSFHIKGIAVAFLLAPMIFNAQTEQEIKVIKSKSDIKSLKVLQRGLAKQFPSVEKLKSQAQKKQIIFSDNSNGNLFQIAYFDPITGKPVYYLTTNTGAAAGTRANMLSPLAGSFNLEGNNMTVHEWDGGSVLVTHQEFENRAFQKDNSYSNNDHSTHVAGTLIAKGLVAGAKGMAPKAILHAYDWNSDAAEMAKAAADGAILSNHSYGFAGGYSYGTYSGNLGWHWLGDDEDEEFKMYGKYAATDRHYDIVALNAPYYLQVKAAGNPRGNGPEDGEAHYVLKDSGTGNYFWQVSNKVRQKNGGKEGFDCIHIGATGKNILVVGAVHKLSKPYSSPSDVIPASFSAFGPTDDGRIKPDIAGIGVGIYSPIATGGQNYGTKSGTSMASPNITGSLVLLQEHYRNLNNQTFMKAATLRALIANTSMEAGDAPGPDYKFGWGLLDAYNAALAITSNNKISLIQEKTLQNGEETRIKVRATSTKPIKATIAWADPVPTTLVSNKTLNDRTKTLVNDLDIKIIAQDGTEHRAWTLDPTKPAQAAQKGDNTIDNIEQVVIENPVGGQEYEIVISHKGQLQKNLITPNGADFNIDMTNADSQDYSLVVTGINNNVENDVAMDKITVSFSPSASTSTTPVHFDIVNNGRSVANNVVLKYKLINKDENDALVISGEETIPSISAGALTRKTVDFNIEKSFVNYEIAAEIVAQNDEIAENNKLSTETFSTVADITKPGSSHQVGFEQELDRMGWTTEDTDGNTITWEKHDNGELARTGESFALNYPSFKTNINDWLFSNALKVKGGVLYRVVLNVKKFRPTQEEVNLFIGKEPKSSAMLTNISPNEKAAGIDGGEYKKYFYEFTPEEDGVIYVGFNHKSEGTNQSFALGMDDVVFEWAEGKPSIDFRASKTNPTTFEAVSLLNETVSAKNDVVSSYEWIFEPNEVEFTDGTDKNSESPKVIFKKDRTKYNVTLKATNSKGEAELSKTEYISTKNITNVANFKVSAQGIISEGTMVNFVNTSSGNPMPHSFEWKITPDTGWQFVNGTNANTPNIQVKFNKHGSYTVALTATSANNVDTETKEGVVRVLGDHEPVKNLTGELQNTDVKLDWKRPNIKPFYKETFENIQTSDLSIIDGNNDGNTFIVTETHPHFGKKSLISITASSRAADYGMDEYFITPKIMKGAEVLKYSIKHESPERYDVYLIPANGTGTPTVDQIKSGHQLLSFNGYDTPTGFVDRQFDISQYTTQDFYIAFHHKTYSMDKGYLLALDDIEVGYKNDYHQQEVSTLQLSGYEIQRDGNVITNINNADTLTFTDNGITENGSYTYDVYALYSDGVKSAKETVVINVNNLSTNDVLKNDNGIKVYPNPSSGRFTIDVPQTMTEKVSAKIYDNSGKLILETSAKGKIEIDLTGYPKGTYITELVGDGKTISVVKLLVQ